MTEQPPARYRAVPRASRPRPGHRRRRGAPSGTSRPVRRAARGGTTSPTAAVTARAGVDEFCTGQCAAASGCGRRASQSRPGWRGSTTAGRVGRHVRAGREVRRDRLTAGRTRSMFVTQDGLGRCRRRQGLAAPPAGRKPPATIGWRGSAERLRGDRSFAPECFDNGRALSSTVGHAPHCARPSARSIRARFVGGSLNRCKNWGRDWSICDGDHGRRASARGLGLRTRPGPEGLHQAVCWVSGGRGSARDGPCG